jgi:ABC-type multidrug transport system fused ATPase/permease subunit
MYAWAMYNPAMSLFASMGLVLVVGFGGGDVLAGRMQIGELVAFITLVRFLYEPIGRLHQLNQLFQAGRAAGERVFEILDEPAEPGFDSESASRHTPIRGEVEFRNVGFAYTSDIPTLSAVNLYARPGDRIALVGPTGAGKTTLVNLIMRFYEHTAGEILIDQHPIGLFSKSFLREHIGVVTQESFLFNGSVRQNLVFGKEDATDAEIRHALESANAWSFVDKLPKGLESIVGERGVKLSVGEKQRISIARALLKNPPILILDEATASVDTQTERLIQDALEHLMVGRTSFVIAHRLSTVRNSDQILVLSGGQIIERGSHEELLNHEGLYAKLWQHSFIEESTGIDIEAVGGMQIART